MSNPYFAEILCEPAIMQALKELRDQEQSQNRSLMTSLIDRVEGWSVFIRSITTEEADFSGSVAWIHDVLGDEDSFAIFIQGVVSYEPIVNAMDKTRTNTVILPLFSHCPQNVTLDQRLAFVRAIIGLGCLLPIFCWANSEGKQYTLQRVIHAFILWQETPGYREVCVHVDATVFV